MTETTSDSSGVTTQASGQTNDASGIKTNSNDSVSYETYSKVLGEKKREAELRKQQDARIKELEQQKLEAEGNKDALISNLKKELADERSKHSKTKTSYATKSVKTQIALKAKELGCVDTDLLTKAMDLDSLQVTVVDDDFNVDEQSLMSQLEKLRKDKTFLFKQSGPDIRDGVPTNSNHFSNKGDVDLNKLSTKQILDHVRKAEKVK